MQANNPDLVIGSIAFGPAGTNWEKLDQSVNNPAAAAREWCEAMENQSAQFAARLAKLEAEIAAMRADVAVWRLELREEFQDEPHTFTSDGAEVDAAAAAIISGDSGELRK